MGRGPETRERIVVAARKLFAERGFDGATVAEIARRAEITEGAIYRHFEDKKALFMACVVPAVELAFSRSLAQVQEATDVESMIRSLLKIRLEILEEHQESFDILFTEAPYHPELKRLLQERVRTQIEQVIPATEGVRESGLVRRVPGVLILGLGLTVGMWGVLKFRGEYGETSGFPGSVSSDRLLEDLVQFVLYGVAGEPAREEA